MSYNTLTITDSGISKDLDDIFSVLFEFSKRGLSSNVTSDVFMLKGYTLGTIGHFKSFYYAISMNRLHFSPLDQNSGT